MNYKRLESGVFVAVNEDDLNDGDRIKKEVVKGVWSESNYYPVEPAPAIRNISTGAMQRRFTIEEEVFITSDAAATVIKSRLLNASFCNLDFQDTIDGVTYICGVLAAGGATKDGATAEERAAKLLEDGSQDESI